MRLCWLVLLTLVSSGVDLFHLRAATDLRNQSMDPIRADFSRAKLEGVKFTAAALNKVTFEFARVRVQSSLAHLRPALISPVRY
jgi:uncharacterized protein YjbI with pentapeptide repeats